MNIRLLDRRSLLWYSTACVRPLRSARRESVDAATAACSPRRQYAFPLSSTLCVHKVRGPRGVCSTDERKPARGRAFLPRPA